MAEELRYEIMIPITWICETIGQKFFPSLQNEYPILDFSKLKKYRSAGAIAISQLISYKYYAPLELFL